MPDSTRMGDEITDPTLQLIVDAARIIHKGIATRHDRDPLTVLLAKLRQVETLAPAEPQPDAPTDIAALPDYWDARRHKPDLSRCAAELRIALEEENARGDYTRLLAEIIDAARIIHKGISTRHDGDALSVLQRRLEEDCRKDCDGYWEQHKAAAGERTALEQHRGRCLALAQKWREEADETPSDEGGPTFASCADELEALVKP